MPTIVIFIFYALVCVSITGIISCTIRDYRKKKIDALNPVPEIKKRINALNSLQKIKYHKKLKTGPIVRG